MDIKEEKLVYEQGLPIKTQLCRITHVNPHFHEGSLEFVYCLRGAVLLHAGFQHPTVKKNQIFSIDCGDIHCIEASDDNLALIVHLDLTQLDEDFEFLRYVYFACESENLYPYQETSMKWLQQAFLSLAYQESSPQPKATQELRHDRIANRIMSIMLRYFNYYTYLNYEGYINRELYDRFYRILIYCHKNHMKKITISQLAKQENLSPNYFSQFFRTTSVTSFNILLKFIRSYQAELLLLTTELPVAEIGYACGFSDPKYLYSTFKDYYHRTPTEHRRWHAEFMKTPDKVQCLSGDESSDLLKDYMARWMVMETLNLR